LREILKPASLISIVTIAGVGLIVYITVYLSVTVATEQQAFRHFVFYLIQRGRARLKQS